MPDFLQLSFTRPDNEWKQMENSNHLLNIPIWSQIIPGIHPKPIDGQHLWKKIHRSEKNPPEGKKKSFSTRGPVLGV